MGEAESFIVAGVDGCKAGWLVAVVEAKGLSFESREMSVAKDFADVLSATSDCEVVCIDIPIGLSDGDKPRACDVEAREILNKPHESGKPRGSCVFPAPIRPCLDAPDYESACTNSQKHTNPPKKLSKQTFNILPKVADVDNHLSRNPDIQRKVREIHPEVCFWALNHKQPMQHKKSKVVGREERIRVLTPIFPNVEQIVLEHRKAKAVAPDDILDALVAAWTAGQVVLDKAATLPAKPETDSNELRMEMVYPVEDF
jgi:predicted RNase H-like nuclease